ncbi:MAG TPA: sigma factor-like helix-turn-helix DNA-binding protein [Bacteroidia bacterium]|nr:sigma factor-like helix-turn-helix DNA-binding protein [Bacteroidia bacterium]
MKTWSTELSKLSDSQLVQCAAEGDSRCSKEIVVRHHPHVHRLLHYKLGNAEWEKDAEQETFIIVFIEIRSGHYHDTGHLTQYINSVAWKQALIILRDEEHYVHDSTALSSDEQREEPEEELFRERSPDATLLRLAMKPLTPRQRLILTLRDVDGLSFHEAGLRMEIPEAAARVLYLKATRHVKHNAAAIILERRAALKERRSK